MRQFKQKNAQQLRTIKNGDFKKKGIEFLPQPQIF